jgi:hypothetical protein
MNEKLNGGLPTRRYDYYASALFRLLFFHCRGFRLFPPTIVFNLISALS